MADIHELIAQLEACDGLEPGTIRKMAAAAIEKNAVGFASKAMAYVTEGLKEKSVRPKAALIAAGIGGALGLAALTSAYNEVKFQSALASLKKDPQAMDDLPKAVSLAHMVKRWAPSIAADPQILGGTVKSLMKFPDSYLTFDLAAKLSDAEKKYSATHGIFSILKERVF